MAWLSWQYSLLMPGEVWKPVVGFEGRYEVSNFGRVKSIPLACAGKKPFILKQAPRPGRRVGLKKRISSRHNGWCDCWGSHAQAHLHKGKKSYSLFVHILMAEAFLGPKPAGCVVHHKNGKPFDNRLVNLEYLKTTEHNSIHHAGNTYNRGSKNPRTKFTEKDVYEIKQLLKLGLMQVEIAFMYDVGKCCINQIATGKRWSQVAA